MTETSDLQRQLEDAQQHINYLLGVMTSTLTWLRTHPYPSNDLVLYLTESLRLLSMTESEREQLVKSFQEMSLDIADVEKRLGIVKQGYSAFGHDMTFTELQQALHRARDCTDLLARYIPVDGRAAWMEEKNP